MVNLCRDYFATENEKVKIKEILALNQHKKEQEKGKNIIQIIYLKIKK